MSASKLPSFFKMPRPKDFDFKPRYYDSQKEYINEYKERIKAGDSKLGSAEQSKVRIQEKFESFRANRISYMHKKQFLTTFILILILAWLLSMFFSA